MLMILTPWWIQSYPTDSVMASIFVAGLIYNFPRFFEFQVINVDSTGFYEQNVHTNTSQPVIPEEEASKDSNAALKGVMEGKYVLYTVITL